MKLGNLILSLVVTFIIIFMTSPIIILFFSAFTETNIVQFPPQGFTLKWFYTLSNHPEYISSIVTSLIIATSVTMIAAVIGTLASFAIVRHKFPGKNLLNTFFNSPISLSWIVTGISLLIFYNTLFPIDTMIGIMIAHLIVCTPYIIRQVVASLTGFDLTLEEASRNLGANEMRTFFKITFPLIKTGLLSGAIFAFLISFNDMTLAFFLVSPYVKTFPVVLYNYLSMQIIDPSISAIATIIISITLIMGIVFNKYLKVFVRGR